MAGKKRSLVRRTFRQMDLSFWCLHEHLPSLAALGLSTFLGTALLAAVIALVIRTWNFPGIIDYTLYAVAYPVAGLLLFTLAHLPCAVFAWHRANGQVLTPGECFRGLLARTGRLVRLAILLALIYLFGCVLFGIPLLFLWPRTCLAPLVVLFENERKVLGRSRRLLKEEGAVYALAAVYLLLFLTLGGLIAIPRLLLMTQVIQAPWTRTVREYWWAFEFLTGAILVAVFSVSWCISLTLLYRDIRRVREGEELREKLRELRQQLLPATGL